MNNITKKTEINKDLNTIDNDFIIVKDAKLKYSQEISLDVINLDNLNSISPLDACTCTGNCGGGPSIDTIC